MPLSSHNLKIEPAQKLTSSEKLSELNVLKESLKDTQPVSSLVNCCKTIDQVTHKINKYMKLTFHTRTSVHINNDIFRQKHFSNLLNAYQKRH